MQHPSSYLVESSLPLTSLWHLLCSGELFIARSHHAQGRCFAELTAGSPRLRREAKAAQLRTLERTFFGESQKSIASDLGLSVSTIAAYTSGALCSMMTPHRVSRAPILLVAAAFAADGLVSEPARLEHSEGATWLISVELPGRTFSDRLSKCELEVASCAIEGLPHEEIAAARSTSPRTISNQLASVFGKLKVSGRAELRAKAILELAATRRHQSAFQSSGNAPRPVFTTLATTHAIAV